MPAARRPRLADVTAREAEVLDAIGRRLNNAEISERLFISVRTVESHVSSLLRKLHAGSRRDLVVLAREQSFAPLRRRANAAAALPAFVTPFVGRGAERAALASLIEQHRLVTAVGPGGVGKTRLAVHVAADTAAFADGVCYVDLVPVTDPNAVVSSVANAFDLGEHQQASAFAVLVDYLTQKQLLLVLDNCEHVLDGVGTLLETLLTGCAGLTVLATSRARLLVPFERTFPVSGLTVDPVAGRGDAVSLFGARVAEGGTPIAMDDPDVGRRVARICSSLDGVALAIELAAARYPSVGLDGLEEGLGRRLSLLSGGRRADDRHRSLRSALGWSYALVDERARAVLRRCSVFVEPFTVQAATAVVASWPPVPPEEVAGLLAHLADHCLLTVVPGRGRTRYRALETVRQFGEEQLVATGEHDQAAERHMMWCVGETAALARSSSALPSGAWEAWQAAFDAVVADLRTALDRASPRQRADAYRLAVDLAECLFIRGMPGESQQRYEQAGALATDERSAAEALRHAAGAAEARHVGTAALELRDAAIASALRAGDRAAAAFDLARNAELINRGPGLMSTVPRAGVADQLIARGWELAGDDPRAGARLATAEAHQSPEDDPVARELADRAIAEARRAGDPVTESAALDCLTAVQLASGEVVAAAATAARRTELLRRIPVSALSATEHFDALIMATECAVAAGNLPAARAFAERLRDLPFYREEGHLAYGRLLLVAVLAGDWPDAARFADRFRDGWIRAGRPRAGNLSRGAYAAATMHGLRGDTAERSRWLDIVEGLTSLRGPGPRACYVDVFEAWLFLHRGETRQALAVLSAAPERFTRWHSGLWRQWYAALWAESAVLAAAEDARERVSRARIVARGNPIAAALVERAAALLAPSVDENALLAVAAALEVAQSRYQWARTLIMLGGEHRLRGEAQCAQLGVTPMRWPLEPPPG